MRINDYVSMSMLHTNAMNQAMNQLQSTNTHLSSGKRINSSADDPSMMLRISRLESNLREQNAVQKNLQDGINMIQTGDMYLSNTQDAFQKLRELSVSYQNDSLSVEDKELIENEATEILKSIRDTVNNATYNSKPLFNGDKFSIFAGNQGTTAINMPNIENYEASLNKILNKSSINKETNTTSEKAIENNITNEQSNNIIININTQENIKESKPTGRSIFGDIVHGIGNIIDGIFHPHKPSNDTTKNQTGPNINININNSNENNVVVNNEQNGININEVSETTESPALDNEKEQNNSNDINQIQSILTPETIDKMFLDPIAKYRSSLGVKQNTLEHQLDISQDQVLLSTSDLSRIVDADMAKEKMKQVQQQMLVTQNLQLFNQTSSDYRQHIASLLFSN